MSLVLTRENLSNQIADDLATRNINAGLIEGAVDTLNGSDTTEGSVAKTVKEQAQKGDFTPAVGSGISAVTLENAVNEVGVDVEALKVADTTLSTELSTVKVKTTENDLAIADIRRDQTLANQSEAKISVSDYGIVALPKNATGNLKVKREGLTARNIVDGASIAIGGTVTFASVLNDIYYDVLNQTQITGTGSDIVVTNDSGAVADMAIINLSQTFTSVPTEAQCKKIFPSYFANTKSVPMTGRYRGSNLDGVTKHDLYLTAPEGRSVPSAKDSVEVQDGKLVHVKRVERYVLQESDLISLSTTTTNNDIVSSTTPFRDNILLGESESSLSGSVMIIGWGETIFANRDVIGEYGKFYRTSTGGIRFLVEKGNYDNLAEARADLAGTVIYYQIATPITTTIDSDGSLPAGASVLWEPAIPDVGIYTTKFDILDTDHPIASIDKLYKVDFATGVQTLLTDAVVAGDGLSFTSASLTDGDLANVIYFYSVTNPEGLTTATYLNSNIVVADSANGKYYKYKPVITNGAIASWTLTEVV